MAKIEDLVAQIPDERLRKAIGAEVKVLKKTKKFGLVFEEHLPETVRLPRLAVKPGELVALKREAGNQLWRVKCIKKGVATTERDSVVLCHGHQVCLLALWSLSLLPLFNSVCAL